MVDPVDRDPGLGARHREVAGREELAAGRGGEPVDPRDDRLRKADDAQHHAAATLEQGLLERLVPVGVHLLQIVPRAERPAGAGQDHDPYRRVLRDPVERILEGGDHRPGQGVEAVRAVEGQGGDAAGGGLDEFRGRLVHLVLSSPGCRPGDSAPE